MGYSISVVIPVYKSGGCLKELYRRLKGSLEAISAAYEIIMVEDGGRDGSWAIIGELTRLDSKVKGIQLTRNFGQHNALLCGILAARHEVIVTIDDDLQHPPEEIHKLLEKLNEGYDVVYGTPKVKQHGFWRNVSSQITKLALQSIMGGKIARSVNAFRAFRADVRNAFVNYNDAYVSIDVLLTWGTERFAAVPVRHDIRQTGKSNYTFYQLVTHALNMMTGFCTLPLQFASLVGFAFTILGVTMLIYVLAHYFIYGGKVPGFPFLASIIAIFSGAQLFALGIIGEYLARIHFRIMEKPPYVIRSRIED